MTKTAQFSQLLDGISKAIVSNNRYFDKSLVAPKISNAIDLVPEGSKVLEFLKEAEELCSEARVCRCNEKAHEARISAQLKSAKDTCIEEGELHVTYSNRYSSRPERIFLHSDVSTHIWRRSVQSFVDNRYM